MNNKGQIIITDLLLYLIVTTVILSLIIFATVTLNDNQVTRINNKELNNLLDNTLDTLTKTSGTPVNWEKLPSNEIKTIGLMSENNQLLSYYKIKKLKNNNQLINKYFPHDMGYELTIYPKNRPNNKEILVKKSLSNKKQIQSKSKVVLIDYGYDITSLNKNDYNEYCYYNHDNNWTCMPFSITQTILNKGKYYIVTNSNIEYILSNTFSENITGTANSIININNQLKELIKHENETIYLHIKTQDNNTYLVYDENNREEYLEKIIKPEAYVLNLKIGI